MMDPIRVPFDKPIIQRMNPLNGILQIPAYYADTGTIFRGRLYWFPLIHRCQPIMELAPRLFGIVYRCPANSNPPAIKAGVNDFTTLSPQPMGELNPPKPTSVTRWSENAEVPVGPAHLTNNTCTSDLLPRAAGVIIAGIIIVDLPTWFDHEQEKRNASPGYHCEHDKKHFHDVPSKRDLRHHRLQRQR
jgi:hypothetical protein